MPTVKLSKMWFGPGGTRYRPGTYEMPEDFIDQLPSSAVVVKAPEPAKPVVEKK